MLLRTYSRYATQVGVPSLAQALVRSCATPRDDPARTFFSQPEKGNDQELVAKKLRATSVFASGTQLLSRSLADSSGCERVVQTGSTPGVHGRMHMILE